MAEDEHLPPERIVLPEEPTMTTWDSRERQPLPPLASRIDAVLHDDGLDLSDKLQDIAAVLDGFAAPVDEHLPTFHVIEGASVDEFDDHVSKHWHVQIRARNGEITFSSENYTELRGAREAAHAVADLIGARVVDDDGSEC